MIYTILQTQLVLYIMFAIVFNSQVFLFVTVVSVGSGVPIGRQGYQQGPGRPNTTLHHWLHIENQSPVEWMNKSYSLNGNIRIITSIPAVEVRELHLLTSHSMNPCLSRRWITECYPRNWVRLCFFVVIPSNRVQLISVTGNSRLYFGYFR